MEFDAQELKALYYLMAPHATDGRGNDPLDRVKTKVLAEMLGRGMFDPKTLRLMVGEVK